MPYNGFGVFNRVYSWQADANAGIDISSSRMDTDTDDITTNGLGLALTRDGQGSAQADLPMNGFKFTGLGAPTGPGQALVYGQPSLIFGGDVTAPFGTTGVELVGNAATQTDTTTAAGTVAANYASTLGPISFATASNAIVLTNGYGLYCAAPIAGANVTLTNGWALGADNLRVNGIAQINQLSVGATGGADLVDFYQSLNGATIVSLENDNAGVSANMRWRMTNGVNFSDIIMVGANSTIGGIFRPAGMLALCDGPGGLTIGTTVAQPVYVAINSAEKARFGTDGSLLVGSTTNAGAGSIGATGNITAFYSDDRLKTRLGDIEDPIGKVMALKGFYFEENDRAVELGYVRKRKVGLSAQDLQRQLPEAVTRAPISDKGKAEDGSDYLTTFPEQIIPLLIEAIKAQQGQIAQLRAGIAVK